RCAVESGGPMAAAHRIRHAGAAWRRAVLRELRPLLLPHLAAHVAGGRGVGAWRRARSPAPALSRFYRGYRQASLPHCARARVAAHGGDDGAVIDASCAGRSASKTRVNALMTRASIFCAKSILRRWMDCRVKPGNDDRSLALMRFRGDERREKT